MTVYSTRVAGPVRLPDASVPPDGAKIIFTLLDWDKSDDALIMHGPVEAVVTGGGIDVQLHRTSSGDRQSQYRVDYCYYNAAARAWVTREVGRIATTGPGPVELADLLSVPAPDPTLPDALAQALAAAASAEADADIATAARAAVEAYSVVAPAFVSWSAAAAVTVPMTVNYIWVDSRMYRRNAAATAEFTTGGGARWEPAYTLASSDLPILILATGQSNALGGSGTGTELGERRTINGNVYLWEQFPGAGQTTGWKRAGPANDDWPFLTTGNYAAYHLADMIQRATGRVVCIAAHAAGGTPQAEWLPAGGGVTGATGSMFATLTAIMAAVRGSAVPGRSDSATFASLGVTEADIFTWWQGEADADYRAASDTRAASYAQYLARFWQMMRAMRYGEGTSADPMLKTTAPAILHGLLPGGTSGGSPTDDRNDALRKLGQGPENVFIPSDYMRSTDDLHVDGAWLVEAARRAFFALGQFPKSSWVEYGASGGNQWEKYSDGRLVVFNNTTIPTVACNTAAGAIFRAASPSVWTFPTGAGVPTFLIAPNITAERRGVTGQWAATVSVSATSASLQAYGAATDGTARGFVARADGRWLA